MKLILIFMISAASLFAGGSANDVQTFTLKNGMKNLVLENSAIPNANMYLFYKVGSRNEYIGITGISHFCEHMMFNGAKKYGPKQFDRTMEANGGANNAYTSENITAYTNFFPSSSLELIFDLEADRIAHLDKVAIQGNLDPTVLYADSSFIKREARKVLESFGKGQGHIFNLGHGILPDIDPENVKVLVNYVKEESKSFHH